MPEEETLDDEVEEVDDAPKGGSSLGLIVAIIAFLAAVAAIAFTFTSKPDTSAIEARIDAVEQSVQTNAESAATVANDLKTTNEGLEQMIIDKIAEQEAANEAATEVEEVTEDE
jgi:flagellar basal body-associated protein FliL